MIGIAELLGRMRNIQARESLFRLAIQAALKKEVGLDVPLESISPKGTTVVLKGVDQAARSTIFIKKESILNEINTAQAARTITDIR